MGGIPGSGERYCRTSLNYSSELGVTPVDVDIVNGRTVADKLGWETCGFELMEHEAAVVDWHNDAEIQGVHYAEMAALAKRLSGCRHAIVSGHISRNREQAAVHEDFAPISFVHSDFTETYGGLVKKRYAENREDLKAGLERAGIDAADVVSSERILILQFWRNVGPKTMDLPLAFCDARSVSREDLRSFHVPNYGGADDYPFDTFGVAPDHSDNHAWFAYPGMTPREVVVLRTYDSSLADQHLPFWTPHSAFSDPTVAAEAPPRSSIELRATCLF